MRKMITADVWAEKIAYRDNNPSVIELLEDGVVYHNKNPGSAAVLRSNNKGADMRSEVIRQVKAEGSDLVAMVNGVEVFRGRAGAIVDKAYSIVEAVAKHEGEFKVGSEIRENRRMYFVKAGSMILKESASAGKIHDFADRLNGVSKVAPVPSEPHVEVGVRQAPQAEPQADDEDPFADE